MVVRHCTTRAFGNPFRALGLFAQRSQTDGAEDRFHKRSYTRQVSDYTESVLHQIGQSSETAGHPQ